MKRFVLYLLLTLCLAGCAPAAPAPSSASISPPAASSSALEEPALSQPQAAHVPPGSYAPWQEGYAGFLTNLRSSEYRHTLGELDFPGDDMPSDSYSLYDVDKDGVPELFLKCGTCEADYYTLGYTFRGGQVVNLGSFQSGHSSLYTVPGENGIIFREGHMGYGSIEKFSLTDGGSIGPWETLLTETEEDTRQDGYTDPGELIPGSQPIPYYYTCTQFRPADSPALVLPIYDYQGRELPVPMEEAEVRAAIGKVLYENAPLFKQIAWADVNGDGQTDCLLRMERETWTDTFCTVLSVNGDTVYAYFFDSVRDAAVAPDGAVTLQFYENTWERASFFKNQCYTVPTPEPAQSDGLAWDPF